MTVLEMLKKDNIVSVDLLPGKKFLVVGKNFLGKSTDPNALSIGIDTTLNKQAALLLAKELQELAEQMEEG